MASVILARSPACRCRAELAVQYYNAFWETAGVPGTGLTVSCTIGNYIQSVPVINGGSGFTRPPTFTISDSGTGTGAAAVAVMSGPLPTDVLTYFATSGWLTTKVQSTSGLLVPPATNAFVTNWVGQLEGPTGRMIGFTAPPSTLLAGGNVCGETPYENNICFMGKNKLRGAMPWNISYFNYTMTIDSNHYPQFWTPGGWIYSTFYSQCSPPVIWCHGTVPGRLDASIRRRLLSWHIVYAGLYIDCRKCEHFDCSRTARDVAGPWHSKYL